MRKDPQMSDKDNDEGAQKKGEAIWQRFGIKTKATKTTLISHNIFFMMSNKVILYFYSVRCAPLISHNYR